ncbi:hypothetical protein NC652_015308 [Populus alba x Populus x berolinensis]|nr:hypothetical protein NC652_015308 [Populus alba x Populus x berolinensis]
MVVEIGDGDGSVTLLGTCPEPNGAWEWGPRYRGLEEQGSLNHIPRGVLHAHWVCRMFSEPWD